MVQLLKCCHLKQLSLTSVVLFIILSKVVVAFECVNVNSHMKDTEQYSFRPCCLFSSTRWFRIEPG